jgi:hypothetical protein
MKHYLIIYVFIDKAYIPILGKTKDGIGVALPPISICDLSASQLASTIQTELDKDEVELPRLHYKEIEQKGAPLLQTIGVNNANELARRVHTYALTFEDDKVFLDQTLRNGPQKGVFDPSKRKEFRHDTGLWINVARAIIEESKD